MFEPFNAAQFRYLAAFQLTRRPAQAAGRLGHTWHTINQWHRECGQFAAQYDRIDRMANA